MKICSNIRTVNENNLIDITQLKNEKSFEYIFLQSFISFMSNFYDERKFQVRLLKEDTINGIVATFDGTYYSLINTGTIARTYESAKKIADQIKNIKKCNQRLSIDEQMEVVDLIRDIYIEKKEDYLKTLVLF